MYRIISSGHYYMGNYSFTKKKQKAKTYKTVSGASQAITKAKLTKTRIEKLEDSEQLEEFKNSFDAKYTDNSSNGLIHIKSKSAKVKKLAHTPVDDVGDELFETIESI